MKNRLSCCVAAISLATCTAFAETTVIANNISDPTTVTVDFRIDSGGYGDFELYIDAAGPYYDGFTSNPYLQNGYRIGVHPQGSDNPNGYITKWVNGTSSVLTEQPNIIQAGTQYSLRVERSGASVAVYLNDSLFMQTSDATYQSGDVVVRTWGTVWWGNLLFGNPTHTVSTPGAPRGQTSVGVGQKSPYVLFGSGQCSEGHPVEARFDFGDGTISTWDQAFIQDYVWDTPGAYEVRCQVRCTEDHAVISSWSEATHVQVGGFSLLGIEVTQCVQNWSNDVPLLAGKTTAVRCHIVSEVPNAGAISVTLRANGAVQRTLSFTPPTRSAYNRMNTAHALDFNLGEDWSAGQVTFSLQANGLTADPDFAGDHGDLSVDVEFLPLDYLPVRFVHYYWWDGLTKIKPTYQDQVKEELRRLLPVSGLAIEGSTVSRPSPVKNIFGIARQPVSIYDMGVVVQDLDDFRLSEELSGSGVFYIGLVGDWWPNGEWPERPGRAYSIPGFSCVILSPGGNTAAHEVGHLLGRHHVEFEDDDVADADPQYEFVDTGYISGPYTQWDERHYYGSDFIGSTVYDLRSPTSGDVMSYASSTWVSRYTYVGMRSYIQQHIASAADVQVTLDSTVNRGKSSTAATNLLVSGVFDTNTLSGQLVTVQKGAEALSAPPQPGEWSVRILASDDTVLTDLPFTATPFPETPGIGSFRWILSLPSEAAVVSLMHSEVELDRLAISTNPPSVTVLAPNGGETITDDLNVSWSASDEDGDPLTASVAFSFDGGLSWETLLTGVTNSSASVPRDSLRGSSNALVRVTIDDTFHRIHDDSDGEFTVVDRPPIAEISSPAQDQIYVGDVSLDLHGIAEDTEDHPIAHTNFVWMSERDGLLGSGPSVSIPAGSLSEGSHTVSLTVTDSGGHSVTDSVGIAIVHDADMDSLPDSWELSQGLPVDSGVGVYGPSGDYDGDGVSNEGEYQADTQPTNSLSVLSLTGVETTDVGILLRWKGGTGSWQYVEYRPRLGDDSEWVPIFTNTPPTDLLEERELLEPLSSRFFRIKAHR